MTCNFLLTGEFGILKRRPAGAETAAGTHYTISDSAARPSSLGGLRLCSIFHRSRLLLVVYEKPSDVQGVQ